MDSRNNILRTLKHQIVPQVALPEVIQGDWISYPDPVSKLVEMVKFAGASCEIASSVSEIQRKLQSYEQFKAAKRIFSAVPGIDGNVDINACTEPHQLEDLDFVIYPGQFAVAENGAVWLTDTDLRHRVCFFITQFLVLVVRKETIVDNMHQAYQMAQPPQPGFGLFLSGPSKTADIEQSLVIGAHGCRELQLFIL